ncbi:MAG: class I SAM-dependent methyltransferase [Moraxellaceae bacterium]|nr:class I SAM-dependent methyltransferase [Moraxellaceae bacterium]
MSRPQPSPSLSPSTTYRCACCGGGHAVGEHVAQERMYGTMESFVYRECAACGSLQLATPPADMGAYYREPYASWQPVPGYVDRPLGYVSRTLRGLRFARCMGRISPTGAAALRAFGKPEFPYPMSWFIRADAGPEARVFDFGCGNARLLRYLRYNGYRYLCGHDRYARGQDALRMVDWCDDLDEAPVGGFDLVMAHHSLEHLDEPLETLQKLGRLVRPGGTLLVRVPLAQCQAWQQYGTRWVQLDAPRHQVLPSAKGMAQLLERAGLELVHVEYDSSAFQFIGSEQYLLDIAMYDPQRSYLIGKNPDLFSSGQLDSWTGLAHELNQRREGDQACFYARPANPHQ